MGFVNGTDYWYSTPKFITDITSLYYSSTLQKLPLCATVVIVNPAVTAEVEQGVGSVIRMLILDISVQFKRPGNEYPGCVGRLETPKALD